MVQRLAGSACRNDTRVEAGKVEPSGKSSVLDFGTPVHNKLKIPGLCDLRSLFRHDAKLQP